MRSGSGPATPPVRAYAGHAGAGAGRPRRTRSTYGRPTSAGCTSSPGATAARWRRSSRSGRSPRGRPADGGRPSMSGTPASGSGSGGGSALRGVRFSATSGGTVGSVVHRAAGDDGVVSVIGRRAVPDEVASLLEVAETHTTWASGVGSYRQGRRRRPGRGWSRGTSTSVSTGGGARRWRLVGGVDHAAGPGGRGGAVRDLRPSVIAGPTSARPGVLRNVSASVGVDGASPIWVRVASARRAGRRDGPGEASAAGAISSIAAGLGRAGVGVERTGTPGAADRHGGGDAPARHVRCRCPSAPSSRGSPRMGEVLRPAV